MVRTLLPVAVLAASLLATACSSDPFGTLPTDTSTPATTLTETFDGSLTVNGAVAHPFVVSRAGGVTATLSAVEPQDAIIGISLGTWNSGSNVCQFILGNDAAPAGATVIGTASVPGNFCVRVYDVGKLTAPAGYQLTVVHF